MSFYTRSGGSPPEAVNQYQYETRSYSAMPVPLPEHRLVYSTASPSPHRPAPRPDHRTIPVFSLAVAAHLATLGHKVVLAPSRRNPAELIWLAPREAHDEASKFALTLDLLGDERKAAHGEQTQQEGRA
jgi:hypothetical protein